MFLTICLSSTLQKTVSFPLVNLSEVNRSESYRLDASGKALNSARVLNQIEKKSAVAICPLGKKNANQFLKLAKKDKLKIKYVKIPGYTRECVTVLDEKNFSTTELVIDEPLKKFNVNFAEKKILNLVKKYLPKVDAVILAGSRPKFWNEDFQTRICKVVKESQKILLADFCGNDLLRTLETCTPEIIKINEEEFCKTFGFSYPLPPDELKTKIIEKATELKNIIIVTRGVQETFASVKTTFYTCPVEKINPVNTTACGDSFNAGFIYEFIESRDTQLSLEKGTWCAARNAESKIPGDILNNQNLE